MLDIDIVKRVCGISRKGETFLDLGEILSLGGWSGVLSKKLKNNLCYCLGDDLRYLEIGVFNGIGATASLYKINPKYAVGVDPYDLKEDITDHIISEQTTDKEYNDAIEIFKRFNIKIELKKRNCWKLSEKDFSMPFNFYFYDAQHDKKSQRLALEHFYHCLDDKFIFCVDDWNVKDVREGTLEGIKNMDLKIELQEEFFSDKDSEASRHGIGNSETWWNGYVVFILKK